MLFCLVFAHAQHNMFVVAKSGIRLHDKPNQSGNVITAVAFGRELTVLDDEDANPECMVEGVKGRFVHVKIGKKTGYVFNGFLSSLRQSRFNMNLYVVASSGVRLRKLPNAKADVLTVIPFCDSIKTEEAYLPEFEVTNKMPERAYKADDMDGYWLKVKYKNQIGYVFNGFLSLTQPKVCNDNYICLPNTSTSGSSTCKMIANFNDFNWFGIDEKNIKAITKISYTSSQNSCGEYILINSDPKDCLYFIGISKKQPKSPIKIGFYKTIELTPTDATDEDTGHFGISTSKGTNRVFGKEKLQVLIEETGKNPKNGKPTGCTLTLKSKNKTQLLCQYKKPITGDYYGYDFRIDWAGDLDMDGKTDFILFGKNFSDSQTMNISSFYLSSLAENGNLVGAIPFPVTISEPGCY